MGAYLKMIVLPSELHNSMVQLYLKSYNQITSDVHVFPMKKDVDKCSETWFEILGKGNNRWLHSLLLEYNDTVVETYNDDQLSRSIITGYPWSEKS